jgi:AraC-like DNA-binding protein
MGEILYIKGMVCVRCVMAVETVLSTLSIPWADISLGKVELQKALTEEELSLVNQGLKEYELELMGDRKKILVERIKTAIIELLHNDLMDNRLKLSEYLSSQLNYDYTYLSNHFSEMEGSTIERFYLVNRIERVKELIVYEGLNVTEISYRLQYSSVSHLCSQFRKIAGCTPADFKRKLSSPDFAWREITRGRTTKRTDSTHENE